MTKKFKALVDGRYVTQVPKSAMRFPIDNLPGFDLIKICKKPNCWVYNDKHKILLKLRNVSITFSEPYHLIRSAQITCHDPNDISLKVLNESFT